MVNLKLFKMLAMISLILPLQVQSVSTPLFQTSTTYAGFYDGASSGGNFNWGFSFQADQNVNVTGIGIPQLSINWFPYTYSTIIPVHVWNQDTSTLVYTNNFVYGGATTLIGDFAFMNIAPGNQFTLQAGTNYIIDQYYQAAYGVAMGWPGLPFMVNGVSWASPYATYGTGLHAPYGSVSTMPTVVPAIGVYMTNLLVEPVIETPEPETYLLIGSMLLLSSMVLMRNRSIKLTTKC